MIIQRNGIQDEVEEERRSKWKYKNICKDIETETAYQQEENHRETKKEESKTRTNKK